MDVSKAEIHPFEVMRLLLFVTTNSSIDAETVITLSPPLHGLRCSLDLGFDMPLVLPQIYTFLKQQHAD